MPIPQTVSHSYNTLLTKLKTWFICKFVTYSDISGTYRFIDAGQWSLVRTESSFKALITIVHRSDYSEYHRSLPITDLRELQAVLRMDMPTHSKHLVSELKQNMREVTSYVFNDELRGNIAFYRALLPVSRVIASGVTETDCLIEVHDDASYFVCKFDGRISSQKKSNLINSASMFCLSSGVGDSIKMTAVAKEELAALLALGLIRMPMTDLLRFSYFSSLNLLQNIKQLVWITGAIVLGYMSLTSLLLLYQYKNVTTKVEILGPKLDTLLDKQQQLVAAEDAFIELNEFAQNNINVKYLIQLLIDTKKSSAVINDFQSGTAGVVIRGQVGNASELLLKLRSLAYVQSAEFKAPTVKVESFEEYSIQIVLKRTGPNG